ncbi:sigma-70 family RNA polymerase sigma factor [Nocardioides zeae]|uniref:Sigma-70 family RNA polymerase sigma factor n=1 Tax=Nocardioides zeae TaxID=1457234 RepID=A0A6P0HF85_9ACTN|nr:sigma-70 family RNA polymerase sigma factor [Nocardioides zeae]
MVARRGDRRQQLRLRSRSRGADHITTSRRRAHLTALLPRATRDSPTTESPHDLQVERLHLQELLQQLPPRQRQAVVLRYLEDLPVERVAELMSIRPGTVKSNAHDGRRALHLLIEAQQQREILQ